MGCGGHNVPIIKDEKGIRKLTPRECFNFQGFDIDYILPSTLSNTDLYKLAGNAVSLPVVKMIAEKVINYLQSSNTSVTCAPTCVSTRSNTSVTCAPTCVSTRPNTSVTCAPTCVSTRPIETLIVEHVICKKLISEKILTIEDDNYSHEVLTDQYLIFKKFYETRKQFKI
jgi:hypothetical protein